MADKRFRTRKQWNNTLLVLGMAPFLLLVAASYGFSSGRLYWIGIAAGVVAVLTALAVLRDRGRRASYVIRDGRLMLSRGRHQRTIAPQDIVDASLIERSACRDYVRKKAAVRVEDRGGSRRAAERAYLRFCTIDIGLSSYTLGLGRQMIDRMPSARADLLLLRTRDGDDVVLSPEYNQDMLEHISRVKRAVEAGR
ncbi:MAG: hypothetical protein QY325_07845 [Flavobacteriales bacterium]|jgi:hypothetical protein|nr:MAG: hypothetical protein QY325_07845 [Flavobacteriales bacterium]